MKAEMIIMRLEQAKQFVSHNARDATEEQAEDIQSLLSRAIEAAKHDNLADIAVALDAVDRTAAPGWDLTSDIREYLRS